ncbi:hypothetical protein CCANI_00255 [Corynebacterium canis]|nr:hypothetical protein CCANI_00255 [Corynebacterium canis]
MKKFRTIAGQRLHTTYQGKLLARPRSTDKIELSRTTPLHRICLRQI